MKATKSIIGTIFTLSFALGQIGCAPQGNQPATEEAAHESGSHGSEEHGHDHPAEEAEPAVHMAIAELQPTEGNEAHGTVTFTKVDGGIQVVAELQGLKGGSPQRGFHIHEKGDCSAPDGTSAGGHFNPEGAEHGAPDGSQRHVGDFGNIDVDENGNARKEFIDTHISFEGPHSIIGRAVIIHAGQDDLQSQPTGAAGARVACGVIQTAEYEK